MKIPTSTIVCCTVIHTEVGGKVGYAVATYRVTIDSGEVVLDVVGTEEEPIYMRTEDIALKAGNNYIDATFMEDERNGISDMAADDGARGDEPFWLYINQIPLSPSSSVSGLTK
mgnify:CR=1 FL=1